MLLIQIQELLDEYYDTYVTDSGSVLYVYNNAYMYRITFSNNKLSGIEITDVNVKDMKICDIPSYVTHLNNRKTEIEVFLTRLNDFVNNVLLFDLDIPTGLTQEQQEQFIKEYLLNNYITNEIYNVLRG